MERIASFNVDHTCLVPGLYLSRVDGNVTTLDMRFKKPNTGDLLSNAEMHSVEHIMATFLRNSERKDAIIYFGPMGCQTGFYFLFDNSQMDLNDAVNLLKKVSLEASMYVGDMPGKSAVECGNYINLDTALARDCMTFYYEVIKDWSVEALSYPEK